MAALKSISAQFANEMDGISLNCFASIFNVLEKPPNSTTSLRKLKQNGVEVAFSRIPG
jgi:hypothetical protein